MQSIMGMQVRELINVNFMEKVMGCLFLFRAVKQSRNKIICSGGLARVGISMPYGTWALWAPLDILFGTVMVLLWMKK